MKKYQISEKNVLVCKWTSTQKTEKLWGHASLGKLWRVISNMHMKIKKYRKWQQKKNFKSLSLKSSEINLKQMVTKDVWSVLKSTFWRALVWINLVSQWVSVCCRRSLTSVWACLSAAACSFRSENSSNQLYYHCTRPLLQHSYPACTANSPLTKGCPDSNESLKQVNNMCSSVWLRFIKLFAHDKI